MVTIQMAAPFEEEKENWDPMGVDDNDWDSVTDSGQSEPWELYEELYDLLYDSELEWRLHYARFNACMLQIRSLAFHLVL